MKCMFYGLRNENEIPGWHYIVNLVWLYHVCPDLLNIIIKCKYGMTVYDKMLLYEFLVKQEHEATIAVVFSCGYGILI